MKTPKIALVISRFNEPITSLMRLHALERCRELGLPTGSDVVYTVPGVVEIPLIAQQLALTKSYQARVVLGAVIRGETDHYDYVCSQVSYGCQKVALEQHIPIVFGILTCETKQQALDRLGGKKGNKAKDAIDTALEMHQLLNTLALPLPA